MTKARNDGEKDGLDEEEIKQNATKATPAYLRGRVQNEEPLPEAVYGLDDSDDGYEDEDERASEKLLAVMDFVLDADRFREEWFKDLLDTMMMSWDPGRKRA